jgi:CubicO group peptidase (beta-lactamase class C family)
MRIKDLGGATTLRITLVTTAECKSLLRFAGIGLELLIKTAFRPYRGFGHFWHTPTAHAVGYNLSPLRGSTFFRCLSAYILSPLPG